MMFDAHSRFSLPAMIALLASFGVGLGHAAPARDPFAGDGNFSFCEDRDFAQCRLLTQDVVAGPRFNNDERRLLKTLELLAGSPSANQASLKVALGAWRLVTEIPSDRHEAYGISWEVDPALCPTPLTAYCDLGMVFADGQLSSVRLQTPTYIVQWFAQPPTAR
jgi:hypothetical protein